MAVSGQRLIKHIPAATYTNVTKEELLFSMWSVPRRYRQGIRSVDTSVWETVKKLLDTGGRRIAIVGAVTRKRLVTDREHQPV
jgi:hypothetical protein